MKMTSSNQRMCVLCRKRFDKKDLIRITRVNNIWYLNLDNKLQGRSIYIENDQMHLDKLLTIKQLKNSQTNIEELLKQIKTICTNQSIV